MINDLISRQAAIDLLARTAGVGNRALDKIRLLPSIPADDLITRKAVMAELVRTYNERYMLGEKDGLKLAWIESAVYRTPAAGKEEAQDD